MLYGRVHRRQLRDGAEKTEQHLAYARLVDPDDRLVDDDLALGIGGRGGHAQAHAHPVAFIRIQQIGGEFGRIAETAGQEPGRQRIEAPGMTGLGGAVEPLHALQGVVRRQAQRLIQQQDAGDISACITTASH